MEQQLSVEMELTASVTVDEEHVLTMAGFLIGYNYSMQLHANEGPPYYRTNQKWMKLEHTAH